MNNIVSSLSSLDTSLYTKRLSQPEMSHTPVFQQFEQSPRYVRDLSPKHDHDNIATEYDDHHGALEPSGFFGRVDSSDLTELEPIMEEDEESTRPSFGSHRRADLMITGFDRLQHPPGFSKDHTDRTSAVYKDSEISPRSDIFEYSPREFVTSTASHNSRAPVTSSGRAKMDSFEYTPRSVDDSIASRRTSVESLLSRVSSDEYTSRRPTMVPGFDFNTPTQPQEAQRNQDYPWNEREKEHSLDTAIDRMFNAIVDDKDLYGGQGLATHQTTVEGSTKHYVSGVSATASPAAVLPSGYVMIYEVRFKRSVSKYMLSSQAGAIAVGDLVKVEADRGHDLGIICGNYIRPLSELSEEDRCLKHIVRRATHDEKMLLLAKLKDEIRALSVCREMSQRRNMPMTVLDAEFQFDRNKLTFLFTADKRIDFRELVRDLFALFKTRIWMQQIAPDGSISMSPPPMPGAGTYSPPVLSPRIAHQQHSPKPQFLPREASPQFLPQQPTPQYGYGPTSAPPTARELYMQQQYAANPNGGMAYASSGTNNFSYSAPRDTYVPYPPQQPYPNKPPLSPRENYRSPPVPPLAVNDVTGMAMPPYDMEPSFAASVWAKIQEQQMQVQHLQALLYKQQTAAQMQQHQQMQQQLRGKPKSKKDIALPPSSQSAVMTLKAATQSRSGSIPTSSSRDDIRLSPQLSPRMSEDSSSSSLDDFNQSMQGMKFSSSYHNDI